MKFQYLLASVLLGIYWEILGCILMKFQYLLASVLLGIYWEMIHSTPPLSQLPSLYLHARLPSQDGPGSHKQNNNSSGLYDMYLSKLRNIFVQASNCFVPSTAH